MSLELSTTVRNARLDAIQTQIGTSPKLQIWTGGLPANCAAASTGTKLVEMALPSSWMASAAGGTKNLAGSWTASAVAAGIGGYYRIVDAAGTTCHIQGTVTATGGGGDMTLDNTNIAINQVVTVTSYTLTDGNP